MKKNVLIIAAGLICLNTASYGMRIPSPTDGKASRCSDSTVEIRPVWEVMAQIHEMHERVAMLEDGRIEMAKNICEKAERADKAISEVDEKISRCGCILVSKKESLGGIDLAKKNVIDLIASINGSISAKQNELDSLFDNEVLKRKDEMQDFVKLQSVRRARIAKLIDLEAKVKELNELLRTEDDDKGRLAQLDDDVKIYREKTGKLISLKKDLATKQKLAANGKYKQAAKKASVEVEALTTAINSLKTELSNLSNPEGDLKSLEQKIGKCCWLKSLQLMSAEEYQKERSKLIKEVSGNEGQESKYIEALDVVARIEEGIRTLEAEINDERQRVDSLRGKELEKINKDKAEVEKIIQELEAEISRYQQEKDDLTERLSSIL